MERGLTVVDNLRETFVHELAHLARRDGFWNLLRRCAVAVLWVQPLVWVLSRRLEATAEEVCDDHVVQFGADRARYASHLLNLAGRALPQISPSGVGMVSFHSLLGRRIVRILDPSRALSTRAGTRAVLAMLVIGLAGTLLAGLLGVGEGKREARAQTEANGADATKSGPNDKTIHGRVVGPDVPINGRIVDLEGRPVPGVAVKVESIQEPKVGDLTLWIDAIKKGEPPWTAYRHIDREVEIPENARRETTTDQDGRFRLEGLGGERVVELAIKGDTVAYTRINVATRATEPFAARGFASEYGPGTETIYGADFTFTSFPSRLVEGVVRDARTREPMAEVTVESYGFAGSDFVGTASLKTTTDAQGRFRLAGLPKGKGNTVLAVPNDDQPYFQREVRVGDPPGLEPVAVEIELHRGIWITGKVTDKATGEPARGARLHYLPFLENTFVQALPEFDKDGDTDGSQMRYTTRADGTYKLVGMPGRAIVGVDNDDKTPYRSGVGAESIVGIDTDGHFKTFRNPIRPGRSWPLSIKEINPGVGTESVTLDLELDPGLSVRLKAVDTDGTPITGVTVTGCEKYGQTRTFPTAEFAIVSFAPDEERNVIVRNEERKLGKVIRVRAGADAAGPIVVTLEPLATIRGRAVDADGNPVAATKVRPNIKPSGDFGISLPPVVSNSDGRFELTDVPPGCDYELVLEAGTLIKKRRLTFIDATVRPGEPTDVGEVRFKRN